MLARGVPKGGFSIPGAVLESGERIRGLFRKVPAPELTREPPVGEVEGADSEAIHGMAKWRSDCQAS